MNRALPMLMLAALAFNKPARGEDKAVEKTESEKPRPVDIRYQAYARYAAAGQEKERQGGWGPSDNFPRSIAKGDAFGDQERLSVVVTSDESARIGKYDGVHVRIVNRSDERTFISAIDSHLYLVQEAMNDKGEWQAIERMPHGTGPRDCAVGFHRISLQPGQYWNVVGPRYNGSFKTKLRFRLDLGKKDGQFPQPGGKVIYSNEFEGSINREQFQRGPTTPFDLKPL